MRTTFQDRLQAALENINIKGHGSGAFLARITGVTPKAASKWITGENMPRRKHLDVIAEKTGVRKEWLEYGEGEVTIRIGTSNTEYFTNETGGLYHVEVKNRYPIIGWVQAGDWCEAEDNSNLLNHDDLSYETTETKVHRSSFWLKVIGDSMTSASGLSIPEGYLILVDPSRVPENGELVIAKLTDTHEVTFKKFVIDAGEKYLKPLNQTYKTININGNCKIVGVVKEVKLRL